MRAAKKARTTSTQLTSVLLRSLRSLRCVRCVGWKSRFILTCILKFSGKFIRRLSNHRSAEQSVSQSVSLLLH